MKRLDTITVSQVRGVYTSRWFNGGTMFRGYTVTEWSKIRLERLINSGMYAVNIQIRNYHGAPSPMITIRRKS
jgi:hypothetical protein